MDAKSGAAIGKTVELLVAVTFGEWTTVFQAE